MALIGKIRNNSWIIIVMLALGLGGFIVMDMVSAGAKSGGNQFTVGEVNGEILDWNEFQRTERILYPNSTGDTYGQRNYIWNYMVEEQLLKDEGEALGLNVGEEELEELQFGNNLSPIVQRNFRDPNTGQMDRASLDQIKANLGTGNLQPQLEEFWAFQHGEIIKDRLQSKLSSLIKKTIYTPTWMAQQLQVEQGSSMDFEYVLVPLTEMDDSEVELTDEDYKVWMKENAAVIDLSEEMRHVDFVVFNVLPTAEDSAIIRESLVESIDAFRIAENDSQFVEHNYGILDEQYFMKDDLSENIADTIFNMAVGSVHGPYIDGASYLGVKLIDKKIIPDSVDSRHILLRAATPNEVLVASARLDSIKTVIEAGITPFDSLAMLISQDGSGPTGGGLGLSAAGRMVKPFNDLLFYTAEPGELYIITSQFGVHLVEVTDRKYITNEEGVRLAFLEAPIVPSEGTQAEIYDDALEFSGQNRFLEELDADMANKPELTLESAQGLTANGYQFSNLGSGGTSRDIIRWAFEPGVKAGMVAPDVFVYDEPTLFYNSRYVVPAVRTVIKSGILSLNDVKESFSNQVLAKKKGEMLAAKITSQDLASVASQFGVEMDTFNNLNFNVTYLPGLGNENNLIGHVTSMTQGEVAGPIIGVSGVYMVKMIHKTDASLSTDISSFRGQLTATSRNSVDSRLIEAIKSTAEIEDFRYNFY